MKAALLFPLFALLFLPACSGEKKKTGERTVVKREGEPDYVVTYDDQRMDRAEKEAQESVELFSTALAQNDIDYEGFAVKKGFAYDGGTEHMWVTDIMETEDGFEGSINNAPVDVTTVALGDPVIVAKDEISDWMFFDKGNLRGGYTIVALVFGTDEEKKYQEEMGIDFKSYRFLREK